MDQTRRRTVLAAIVVTLGLLAAACGDDSETAEVAADPAAEAAYLDTVRTIAGETDPVIRDAFETVFIETEGLAFETMLPRIGEVIGTVITTQEAAIDRYEALDPPATFAADHERGIEFLPAIRSTSGPASEPPPRPGTPRGSASSSSSSRA